MTSSWLAHATFDNKNVGTGKTVTIATPSLSGTDASNYNLTTVPTDTADITAKSMTGSITAADKVYDGTTGGDGDPLAERRRRRRRRRA